MNWANFEFDKNLQPSEEIKELIGKEWISEYLSELIEVYKKSYNSILEKKDAWFHNRSLMKLLWGLDDYFLNLANKENKINDLWILK